MNLLLKKYCLFLSLVFLFIAFVSCSEQAVSEKEGIDIARKAYLFAYPMVQNYFTIYNWAIDEKGDAYRGPFNQFYGKARHYTPYTKNVHYPNLETRVGYACLDLRAEPLVFTVPKVDSGRYFSIQFTDLFTHNYAYVRSEDTDYKKTRYLLVGPDWAGETPNGISKVIRSQSNLNVAKSRTRYWGSKDLWWVRFYMRSYKFEPLSEYMKSNRPAEKPKTEFPNIDSSLVDSLDFYNFFTWLMQYSKIDSADAELFDDFAKIGLIPGNLISFKQMPAEKIKIFRQGMALGKKELAQKVTKNIKRRSKFYGDRQFFKGNYLNRAIGAVYGLYGSSLDDYYEYIYDTDSNGEDLDASESNYVLRFARWDQPPVKVMWSLTIYDKETGGLVKNELERYQFNSEMTDEMRRAADASINIYFKEKNPEGIKEKNWLPSPDGPFVAILRMYRPKSRFLKHKYPLPEIRKSN